MEKTTRFNLSYLILAAFGVFMLHGLISSTQAPVHLPYSEFERLLERGQVRELVVTSQQIRGSLEEPYDGKTRFTTTRVDPDLAAKLKESGVTYSGRAENNFLPMIFAWVFPILLFFGIWLILMRRVMRGGPGSGLMSIGKSKAKVYVEKDTGTSFDDVAGVDEAKEELQEIVAFLKNPEVNGRLGARMPKGVLLVGPPGTGKTLIARAVAGEAGVPFFSINGSEFVEMFVGVGAARVRDLFEQARQQAPCIIFIDELDALGRARAAGAGLSGGHDEKEQTLNQLLVELDGFDSKSGIVLLGATNRPEVLDPALLRAGRFDRQVLVDRPDKGGRLAILGVHAKKIKVDPGLDLAEVAGLTPGFSGADLENLVNEAALAATRRDGEFVTLPDFTNAIERLVAGLERKNRLLNPTERRIVAYHEMGHAIVAASVPGADPVHKVSIIPRGIGALGYTIQRPTEDRYLMTREDLEGRISVLLGGRAAEWIVFGHLSTGAADDLSRATDIARSMVSRYGMVPELGHVSYEESRPTLLGGEAKARDYSETTAQRIDDAIREIVESAYQRALGILGTHRDVLESTSRDLLERETLDASDLKPAFAKFTEAEDLVLLESPSEETAAV